MKNHFLIMCLAAALLVGCSKEPETLNDNSPVTHIIAKAAGDAEVSLDTKAPFDGSSFNGKTADIYTASGSFSTSTDRQTMFTNAYARGTMTFDATNYVGYNSTDFGGLNGGTKLLPIDGNDLFVYGFYPSGWVRTEAYNDAAGPYETLTYTFDGHHDVMSTWLTVADDVKVAYMDPSVPEQANLTFKHLLTRYNIQIKAADAEAIKIWGRVKSVSVRDNDKNVVAFGKTSWAGLKIGCNNDAAKPSTSFFKLTGATNAPTYTDDKFAPTDYATAFVLTQSYQNACYSLVAPVELSGGVIGVTLEVTTITAAGKELQTTIPVSFDPSKFTANGNSTRGYSITLALNFRMGVIQATAIVEPWKDYGMLYGDVVPGSGTDLTIGKVSDGGVVFWVDPNDAKTYKVVSVVESSGGLAWSTPVHVIGSEAQSDTDGRMNDEAIKAYCETIMDANGLESNLHTVFPASGFCYSYQGKDGADDKGTWYLPAKSELQYLWCAFNGKDPISWAGGTNAAASADATAQGRFNQYLINAGGTSMARDQYDSSTENSSRTNEFWYMNFANSGETLSISKLQGSGVRCVKTIVRASFKVGDLKDGGIVYWIDPLDPSNYRVLSLKQPATTLTVCPSALFMYCAQDGETDGRKNIANMKTYSATDANASKNFATDYPAANYCNTYGSDPAGTWYLPSKSELEEFSKIYARNSFVLNQALASNSGDAITTTAGSRYLTCSAVHGSDSRLYVVDLANNVTSEDASHPVGGMVRCIRRSVPLSLPPAIGELKDGGIVYQVIGSGYKVFSLTGAKLPWAPSDSYMLGDGDGRNETSGKKNLAAMKAYSKAHTGDSDATTRTTGVFATDFPAAAYCDAMNKDGVTNWYLPSKNELKSFYSVYKANPTVFDAAITANSGTAIKYNGYFWSGTEEASFSAWFIDFLSGAATAAFRLESYFVRCIRSTTSVIPPAIGDLKDGGIVYAVNGSNYKVVSLNEGQDSFSDDLCTEEVGVQAQSRTDGAANSAAFKAFAQTKGWILATAYFSVNYCVAMGDGWYLPAIDELNELHLANGTTLTTALENNGGVKLASSYYSSTEDATDTGSILYFQMSNGTVMTWPKGDAPTAETRCIRVN